MDYKTHPSTRRTSHGPVNMFFNDETDQSLARNIIQETVEQTDNNTLSSSDPQTQNKQNITTFSVDSDEKDQNEPLTIKNRFKMEKRFTPNKGEDIEEFVETYIDCCNYVNAKSKQKIIFFIILLTKKRAGCTIISSRIVQYRMKKPAICA